MRVVTEGMGKARKGYLWQPRVSRNIFEEFEKLIMASAASVAKAYAFHVSFFPV